MIEKYTVACTVEVYNGESEKKVEDEIIRRLDIVINDGEDMWLDRSAVVVAKEKNDRQTVSLPDPSPEE